VLDSSAFYSRAKVGSYLCFGALAHNFASEKFGDVVGLDRVDRRANKGLIEALKIFPSSEHRIRCVLYLHDAPVDPRLKTSNHWTAEQGILIQNSMKLSNIERVSQSLSFLKIRYIDKCVINKIEGYALVVELSSEPVVPVEVELKTKWCPRRNA
jgi:hypothetical protein